MRSWNIQPHRSVGDLAFGMTRSEAEAILEGPPEPFHRVADADEDDPSWVAFDREGIHLAFGRNDELQGISVFVPNLARLGNLQLLGVPASALASRASATGLTFVAVDAGLWCASIDVLLIVVDELVDGVEVLGRPPSMRGSSPPGKEEKMR